MSPPYSLVVKLALGGLWIRCAELEKQAARGARFDPKVSAELDDLALLEELLLTELAEAA